MPKNGSELISDLYCQRGSVCASNRRWIRSNRVCSKLLQSSHHIGFVTKLAAEACSRIDKNNMLTLCRLAHALILNVLHPENTRFCMPNNCMARYIIYYIGLPTHAHAHTLAHSHTRTAANHRRHLETECYGTVDLRSKACFQHKHTTAHRGDVPPQQKTISILLEIHRGLS